MTEPFKDNMPDELNLEKLDGGQPSSPSGAVSQTAFDPDKTMLIGQPKRTKSYNALIFLMWFCQFVTFASGVVVGARRHDLGVKLLSLDFWLLDLGWATIVLSFIIAAYLLWRGNTRARIYTVLLLVWDALWMVIVICSRLGTHGPARGG